MRIWQDSLFADESQKFVDEFWARVDRACASAIRLSDLNQQATRHLKTRNKTFRFQAFVNKTFIVYSQLCMNAHLSNIHLKT